MRRTSIGMAIGLTTVVIAVGAYAAYYINRQRSLQAGIAQTSQALRQQEQMIEENQMELARLFSGFGAHAGGRLDESGSKVGGAKGSDDAIELPKPLSDAVDLFDEAKSAYEATGALENLRYAEGIQHTAEAIAGLWNASPFASPLLKAGTILEDIFFKGWEAHMLLDQQKHLIATEMELDEHLHALMGKQLGNQTDWDSLLPKLRSNATVKDAALNAWLERQGITKKNLVACTN